MFAAHSQILCTIMGVNIYYYGVIMAMAIVTGTFVSNYFGEKHFQLPKETIIDLAPYLIIFGIIGSRMYYCLLNYSFYLRFPTEIIAIRHGGISIHGALLGGLVGLIIFAKRKNLSIPKLCDTTVIGLALAQSIGRWGNFFNSEAFGLPTDLPWKLYIAPQYRPIPYTDYNYFHPTFLYESILDILIFGLLIYLLKTNKTKKAGSLTCIYLIAYSIARIFVESLRIDSTCYIFGHPVAIVVSVGIIILAGILYTHINKPKKDAE